MKKILTLIMLFTMCGMGVINAQDSLIITKPQDSVMVPVPVKDTTTANVDTTSTSLFAPENFDVKMTLATKNVWRGTAWGESPSFMPELAWRVCKYAELGLAGTTTLNGTRIGYGNQFNMSVTLKPFVNAKSEIKNVIFSTTDYYYFSETERDNGYFAWSTEKTNHFVEGQVKYDSNFDLSVNFTYLANKAANVDGIYFEAGYDVNKSVNIFAGYVTGPNDLMFVNKGGWTNIGATVSKPIKMAGCATNLKVSVIANPNYENVTDVPGVGNGPVYLVGSLVF